MALALNTWKSVANKGASSKARDEYKFRIVQSSVNNTTHTASYKVQFYGTDTSREGTYEHYMDAVKLKVNGTTVATLLNSRIHMGSGRSSGYTAKYSSSSPYTTSSYTLGPLKKDDKVTVALDSSINTGDTFKYTSETISVSSSIFAPSNYTLTYTANGGTGSNVTQSVKAGSAATLKPANTFTPAKTATWGITLNKDGGTGGDATFVSNAFYRWRIGSSDYEAGASYKPSANTTVKAYWSTNYKLGTPTKAQTSADGYKVTFNTQGGSAVSAITSSKTTTYTFSKWNTKSDGSGTSYNAGASYTANAAATLYAQYTSSTSNGAIKLPTAPTKSGYAFKGWYDAASGGNKIGNAGASYTPTKAITLYAQWTASGYTITYTLNGGTVSGNPTSYTIETATFTLKNPTRTNYTFTGWTGSNGTSPETTVTIEKGSTGNKSYTANWSQKVVSYTISYNYDGGNKGTYAPTSANVDAYVQISNPTRSGYTFKGWSISGMNPTSNKKCYYGSSTTDSRNQSTTSTSLSSITATRFKNLRTSVGTVTFKATWIKNEVEDNKYSITYSLGGGSAGSPAPTSGTKGTYINIANPTRANYEFNGWNITGLDSGTHYHGNSKPSYGNTGATSVRGTSISGVKSTWFSLQATGTVTFTATWTATQTTTSYTISYSLDGGNSGTYAPTTANVGSYVQISNPTKSGYTFKGWNITNMNPNTTYPCYYGTSTTDSSNTRMTSGRSISGTTATQFKNLRRTSGTVTFAATWEAVPVEDNKYNISYSLGTGATAGSPAPTSGTKGTYINIGNPSRTNYTFTGWNITGLDRGTHYHGNRKPFSGNYGATSVTGTSISGVKSTWFSLQATGTVTFTATWESSGSSGEDTTVSYSITYNYDGGVKGTYAPSYANVGEYVQISNPSKSGFTFKGWNITGMNPTSSKRCYYGSSTTDTSNQSTTSTSLSGITATRFKNLRTSAGTVTFTATWEDNTPEEELTGLILRPIADTTLGHTCSSGTAGYSMISETTADDDTTYIYQQITEQTAQSATSTFKLGGTLPSGAFKITGATIRVRGKSDSNGTYSGTYQLSTDSAASNITLSATAYSNTTNSDICNSLIGNIYTSSTLPDISVTITTTGQITSTGTKTGGQTASKIRITQVYLQLEYEPVLGLVKIYTNNAWHNALSYIFINGTWKIVQAHTRKNSNWKPGQG